MNYYIFFSRWNALFSLEIVVHHSDYQQISSHAHFIIHQIIHQLSTFSSIKTSIFVSFSRIWFFVPIILPFGVWNVIINYNMFLRIENIVWIFILNCTVLHIGFPFESEFTLKFLVHCIWIDVLQIHV